jgi:hypothetical protein
VAFGRVAEGEVYDLSTLLDVTAAPVAERLGVRRASGM